MTYDPRPARAALTDEDHRATIEHLETRARLHTALTNGDAPRGLLPASPRTYVLTQQAFDALDDPANLPIMLHDEFMLQVANGEPKALEIQSAVNRWQALRDSAYRAYWHKTGVPVSPARFHDITWLLADLYTDPATYKYEIAAALAALGI